MNIRKFSANGSEIAVVKNDGVCISDAQSALDFMMTVNFETGSHSIIIDKGMLIEDFFILSTKIAGEILQKIINYKFRFAIVGDFSGYNSKSLRDFMYESNKGNAIFFVPSLEEAIERMARV